MNAVKVMKAVYKKEFVGECMWGEADNVLEDATPRALLGIGEAKEGKMEKRRKGEGG
jgi:hypothetical protein